MDNSKKDIKNVSQSSNDVTSIQRKDISEDGFEPRRLRYLRKKHDLKVDQIIKHIGVARSTYTGYEQGHRVPPSKTINKLAELLHTTPNYLCGYTDFEENLDNEDLQAILNSMNLKWGNKQLTDSEKIQIANVINGLLQSVPK
ncbi:TPA: helix-turn-helix transcriptional regulator [Bacillus cereus]|uniref:helix-turn-helix domain-containing protein n=1 Tax=Bacillus cereus TaxID=1396 RepID=UPI0019270A46|nr:helix-turn-helix transcriptional regulator [Bacillus cereus]MBL3768311.1 helix-turn-helix transcriptional regulator [Bacillus cereus]MBL3774290.1 helix-turn-helix transcriptional regulator [Bacillus cereus]MBL3780092.1 helix-turn-helix transcriptional regulator [Bacillus cereus]MBL3791163.1 helix-turn-helix transcriptional regulator [Bacillus cereus]HDR4393141.1 helix-turn-helix transcriptional regulator [Bacillus cereus]